jgi:hypothetical protein
MAGRGRNATLPAWMTSQEPSFNATDDNQTSSKQNPGQYDDLTESKKGSVVKSHNISYTKETNGSLIESKRSKPHNEEKFQIETKLSENTKLGDGSLTTKRGERVRSTSRNRRITDIKTRKTSRYSYFIYTNNLCFLSNIIGIANAEGEVGKEKEILKQIKVEMLD